MKILITGATGFIGTRVIQRLAQTDHQLRCLVRRSSQTDQLKAHNAEIVTGDVTDKASVLEGMKGCDWVINLANVYSFWEPERRRYKEVNVGGTKNVMEAAVETSVVKMIHVSTVGIYGKPVDSPYTEDSAVGPLRFSDYFQTKYEGDLIAWEMYEKKGLPLVMIYPASVLGAGDPKASGKYIKDMARRKVPARIFEDSILTFVHVNDVAEAIVKAMEKENNLGEKYFVGKYQLSFCELNKMISEISGVRLPRLSLPDFMVILNARLLTLLADIIKKPPLWGLSNDQIRVMKEGFIVDGSKAERELGIAYTPVRKAIEEALASF